MCAPYARHRPAPVSQRSVVHSAPSSQSRSETQHSEMRELSHTWVFALQTSTVQASLSSQSRGPAQHPATAWFEHLPAAQVFTLHGSPVLAIAVRLAAARELGMGAPVRRPVAGVAGAAVGVVALGVGIAAPGDPGEAARPARLVTDLGRAGVAVVAVGVRRAAGGDRSERAPMLPEVAGVGRALRRIGAVAIGGAAVRRGRMRASMCTGVAGVHGAGIGVIAVGVCVAAGLVCVVGATMRGRVTGVRRAGVGVVAVGVHLAASGDLAVCTAPRRGGAGIVGARVAVVAVLRGKTAPRRRGVDARVGCRVASVRRTCDAVVALAGAGAAAVDLRVRAGVRRDVAFVERTDQAVFTVRPRRAIDGSLSHGGDIGRVAIAPGTAGDEREADQKDRSAGEHLHVSGRWGSRRRCRGDGHPAAACSDTGCPP